MAGLGSVARKPFGGADDRRLKRYEPTVAAINALAPEVGALTDEELRARTEQFRAGIKSGKGQPALSRGTF